MMQLTQVLMPNFGESIKITINCHSLLNQTALTAVILSITRKASKKKVCLASKRLLVRPLMDVGLWTRKTVLLGY